jgi:uracil-DNA glycosylase
LIAGQAPGRKTHHKGMPFDDPSGDRLRDWMGIGRSTFYDESAVAILPMAFCYPGTGKSGDLPPPPQCAAQWRQPLLKLLPNIQLTLIIGQYAMNWHLGNRQARTLTETVKQWQQYWPDALPMPHPSPRNNRWLKMNPWFEEELLPKLKVQVRLLLEKRISRL